MSKLSREYRSALFMRIKYASHPDGCIRRYADKRCNAAREAWLNWQLQNVMWQSVQAWG